MNKIRVDRMNIPRFQKHFIIIVSVSRQQILPDSLQKNSPGHTEWRNIAGHRQIIAGILLTKANILYHRVNEE
jgi:hypothetical protein